MVRGTQQESGSHFFTFSEPHASLPARLSVVAASSRNLIRQNPHLQILLEQPVCSS